MAKRLFGTDGIRGTAGQFPLDPVTVHAFGQALGSVARHLGRDPRIVIGMDTRESSPWIAAQVPCGLKEAPLGLPFAGRGAPPRLRFPPTPAPLTPCRA